MTSVRETLCKAVAALPPDCTSKDAEEALGSIFDAVGFEPDPIVEGGISPLILACDKGNVACLEYFKKRTEESHCVSALIGFPLDRTSEGNTPMHHAAISGCVPAIAILNSMGSCTFSLGSAKNSHGDTPLMMAAVSGCKKFCEAWHELCSEEQKVRQKDILAVFEMKNDSSDSCLSLACSHGQEEVVEYLLSDDCGVETDPNILRRCQNLCDRRDYNLRSNSSLGEMYQKNTERAHTCLNMLKEASAATANRMARELLESEGETNEILPTTAKPKTKNRKKKKGRNAKGKTSTQLEGERDAYEKSSHCNNKDDTVQITMLPDGTKAVRVDGTSHVSSKESPTTLATFTRRKQRSATEMFRDRFHQVQISSELDAVMQALCLDMSMLLYTSHGMAMDLSPSQLDAIQGILERQLDAVREATAIQERLHSAPQPSGSGSAERQAAEKPQFEVMGN